MVSSCFPPGRGRHPEVVIILVHGELVQHHAGDIATGLILDSLTFYVKPVDRGPWGIPDLPPQYVGPPHRESQVNIVQRHIQGAAGSQQNCLICRLLVIVLRVYGYDSGVHIIVVRHIRIVDVCGRYFRLVAASPNLGQDWFTLFFVHGLIHYHINIIADHP